MDWVGRSVRHLYPLNSSFKIVFSSHIRTDWQASGFPGQIVRLKHLGVQVSSRVRLFNSEAVQVAPKSSIENNRDVEDMFIYTHNSKIEEEKKQACYISKSILRPGLPSCFDKPLNLDDELVEKIFEKFEGHIKDSMLFCYGEEVLHRKKHSVLNIFLNMLQTTWKETSKSYKSNFEKSVFYKQHVTTTVNRCNEYAIQISGKPKRSFLMMSKNPVNPFATKDEISASANYEVDWDEVFSPVFNFQHLKAPNKVVAPFLEKSPFHSPHTLFIAPDKRSPEMKRLIGHGLLYTFAHAFAHAMSKPENYLGMKEIDPVSMQCIINDGRITTFICHQLNTLDFHTNSGIKNFFWIQDNVDMYKYAYLKIPGDKRYKGIKETEIFLEDANHIPFMNFLKFVLN